MGQQDPESAPCCRYEDSGGSLPYFAPAMSRNQRIMLVVVALAVAVIAFVIASPGSR